MEDVGTLRCVLLAALLAAFPSLHIASVNPGQVSWQGIAVVLGCAITAVVVMVILLRLARRSWSSTLVTVTGLLVIIFSFGPVHTWLDLRLSSIDSDPGSDPLILTRTLFEDLGAVWGIFVGLWLLATGRLGAARSRNMAAALPVVIGVLYAFLIAQAGLHAVQQSGGPRQGLTRHEPAPFASSVIGYEPDIYYIVLDGYARADVLQDYYATSNADFLDALRGRGFVVADRSSANYYWTFLSLASSLNFRYLDALVADPVKAQLRGREPFYRAIRDNEAARFLRGRGYRYVHFQSTWSGTLRNEFADKQIGCEKVVFQDDFARAVAELTPLKLLSSRVAVDLADCYRSHFGSLSKLGTVSGPKFVFAHFLPPHHPYLFDRQGRTLRSATITDQFEFQKKLWERRDLYVDQLTYVNARLIEAVDAILATSVKPPIILMQSDHGPNLHDGLTVAEQRAVRFANLSVALLPGAPADLLPSDDSAVNKLPRIFNYYFGTDFRIRPDRHYFSTYDDPFEMVPVSPDGIGSQSNPVRSGGSRWRDDGASPLLVHGQGNRTPEE